MTDVTPAQALEAIRTYFQNLNTDRAQFRDWIGGGANGGPNSDGLYPLTDFTGNVRLVDCPAKIVANLYLAYNAITPYDHIANLTPADTDGPTYNALVVGGTGTVVLMTPAGATITYAGCTAGQIIVQDCKRLTTATTAPGCVGLQRNLSPVSPVPDGAPIAIAPADVDLIGGPAITVYIGVDGHVALRAIDGSEATFANMPAGAKLPVRTIRVKAATTAGGILVAY